MCFSKTVNRIKNIVKLQYLNADSKSELHTACQYL